MVLADDFEFRKSQVSKARETDYACCVSGTGYHRARNLLVPTSTLFREQRG